MSAKSRPFKTPNVKKTIVKAKMVSLWNFFLHSHLSITLSCFTMNSKNFKVFFQKLFLPQLRQSFLLAEFKEFHLLQQPQVSKRIRNFRQTDGWTNGRMDGRMERRTDKQTDTRMERQCLSVFPFCLSVLPFVCLCIFPFVCWSVSLSMCLLVCLSFHVSVGLSLFPFVCHSFHLSVCLSICLIVCLSVFPFVCLSFHISAVLSVFLTIGLFD